MDNVLITENPGDELEETLVHGFDFAEPEMTICGIWTCGGHLKTDIISKAVDCPNCIHGLEHYRKIKAKGNLRK
jgi:hypothetical protein